MRVTHLWKEKEPVETDQVVSSVVIEDHGGERSELWYSVPAEYGRFLTSAMDPFVLGALFRTMRRSDRMEVHGDVSPSLLADIEEYQSVWLQWLPDQLKRVEIVPDREREVLAAVEPGGAICAFSGGLDAAYSACRHSRTDMGRLRRDIKAGLFIQGFDIPVGEDDVFAAATAKCKRMTDSLGLELVTMCTNYRQLDDNWRHSHGLALGSCLMQLMGGYSEGIIGSSFPYGDLVLPWGSNPITDPMMSSDSFRIIHDGSDVGRNDKIRLISKWPEAMDDLQVCWEGKQKDRNCCECEKCIRTILNFRVIGVGLPGCFEKDVEDKQIVSLAGFKEAQLKFMEEILQIARDEKISGRWIKAVETCIKRNRSWWRLMVRKIRSKLALRTRLRRFWSSPGNRVN